MAYILHIKGLYRRSVSLPKQLQGFGEGFDREQSDDIAVTVSAEGWLDLINNKEAGLHEDKIKKKWDVLRPVWQLQTSGLWAGWNWKAISLLGKPPSALLESKLCCSDPEYPKSTHSSIPLLFQVCLRKACNIVKGIKMVEKCFLLFLCLFVSHWEI